MDNAIAWLKRNSDSIDYVNNETFAGEYLGHRVRYFGNKRELDVGFQDFDRWANSLAHTATIESKISIPKQINLAIIEAKKNINDPPWYATARLINKIFN